MDRVVMRYDYDMLGNRIHQASMEAGERWMLNDVAGKPIRAWDSRGHAFRTEYDALRRPLRIFVTGATPPTRPGAAGRAHASTASSSPNAEAAQPARQARTSIFDQAGVVTNESYDFKGNLLRSQPPAGAGLQDARWTGRESVPLEAEIFTSRTRYDALNRPIQLIAPHSDQPDAKRQRHPARATTRPTCWSRSMSGCSRRRAGRLLDPVRPTFMRSPTSTTTPRASARGSTTATASAPSTTTTR